MRYLLDTDLLSDYRVQVATSLVDRVDAARRTRDIGIAVISVEEQLSGWYTLIRRANTPRKLAAAYRRLAEAVRLASDFPILLFNEAAIARFLTLTKLKLNVGKNDLKIAAIALETDLIVVTRNLRDFRRVPGLNVEDWSS
jgi:tRNA(fMet)-specific endonuclease VapC